MLNIRRAADRGQASFDWLDSRHTFSFGHYYDPAHMGFGPLRVINEDRVRPGAGFATHGHEDMEIISWVLEGALAHEDSLGNGSIIRPGEVQRMSAGTGIRHSEFNHSKTESVHFLQIWVLPERKGLAPGYEQKSVEAALGTGELVLIASPDGRAGAASLHQDADLYAARPSPGRELVHEFRPGRGGWLQVARGRVRANGEPMEAGDGAAVTHSGRLSMVAEDDAEVLLFDMG